ncbi:serine/threonine-protein kinase PLK1-like [Octopus sinensis]|uniref:Serine/threonine-protein kinase PLK1-like n=1 Tax=Octopus sinensis TaxID=2607531 RepID=A0A7E6EJ03_9MOLL|nr:serine/threonine-protein kinase PLK1-like [Octopus sinensis]
MVGERMKKGEVKEIMRQLCAGVEYIHSRSVIHRDIKPSNILFSANTVKLADFGLATQCKKVCGTPNYIAPEILHQSGYSFPVDIWSLGCVLYAFLLGRPPFHAHTVQETYARVRSGHFSMPNTLSPDWRTLLANMLSRDATRRPLIGSIHFSKLSSKEVPVKEVCCLVDCSRRSTRGQVFQTDKSVHRRSSHNL